MAYMQVSLVCHVCGKTNYHNVLMGFPTRVRLECKCGTWLTTQTFKQGDPNVVESNAPHVVEALRREVAAHEEKKNR